MTRLDGKSARGYCKSQGSRVMTLSNLDVNLSVNLDDEVHVCEVEPAEVK